MSRSVEQRLAQQRVADARAPHRGTTQICVMCPDSGATRLASEMPHRRPVGLRRPHTRPAGRTAAARILHDVVAGTGARPRCAVLIVDAAVDVAGNRPAKSLRGRVLVVVGPLLEVHRAAHAAFRKLGAAQIDAHEVALERRSGNLGRARRGAGRDCSIMSCDSMRADRRDSP